MMYYKKEKHFDIFGIVVFAIAALFMGWIALSYTEAILGLEMSDWSFFNVLLFFASILEDYCIF